MRGEASECAVQSCRDAHDGQCVCQFQKMRDCQKKPHGGPQCLWTKLGLVKTGACTMQVMVAMRPTMYSLRQVRKMSWTLVQSSGRVRGMSS